MNNNGLVFRKPAALLAGGLLSLVHAPAVAATTGQVSGPERPNIVIILSDDLGYADVSYHNHPSGSATPAIDRIAGDGVVFTNGYVSAYVCAPTRAGLLTGRYQQRFGFYRAPDSRAGMPLDEITLADMLKKEGYATGVFGKWHLGIEPEYHPMKRGFDEFYGFLGHGGHDYFDLSYKPGDDLQTCIYRNENPVDDSGYLTDNLGREACAFIEKHSADRKPFFLYLPFNAVHFPMHAPEEDIRRFNSGDPVRDIQLAMIYRMDIAIGKVIQTLKEQGVYGNTLLFFLNDNGGARVSKAINLPLRDYKHSMYEGGIRVPFIICWPDRLSPGKRDEPVISLDILPTVCAAAGVPIPAGHKLDGKNLLPLMENKQSGPAHTALFWDGNDGIWAVRAGNWKLVSAKGGKLELYNLKEDLSEGNNLAETYPDRVLELKGKFDTWRGGMAPPMGQKKRN